jgi:hypothetical protein
MNRPLTRRELYELVWSQPRTQIANDLGISDVAVAKLCKSRNVPAPPRGYWARLASTSAKKKPNFLRPPLPYTVFERVAGDHEEIEASNPTFEPEKLDEPVTPPPSFPDTQEEALARYAALVAEAPRPTRKIGHHPIVERFVAEDERLLQMSSPMIWDKPKFVGALGREMMAGMNRLFWWWAELGLKPAPSGTRHITMHIPLGQYGKSFEIRAEGVSFGVGYAFNTQPMVSKNRFELHLNVGYGRRSNDQPFLAFDAFDEKLLVESANKLIEIKEESFRSGLIGQHAWLLERRERAIREDLEAQEEERQQREEERLRLEAARDKALDDAIDGIKRADEVRRLVAHVEGAVGSRTDVAGDLARWKAWALAKAVRLDVRSSSTDELVAWLSGFRA